MCDLGERRGIIELRVARRQYRHWARPGEPKQARPTSRPTRERMSMRWRSTRNREAEPYGPRRSVVALARRQVALVRAAECGRCTRSAVSRSSSGRMPSPSSRKERRALAAAPRSTRIAWGVGIEAFCRARRRPCAVAWLRASQPESDRRIRRLEPHAARIALRSYRARPSLSSTLEDGPACPDDAIPTRGKAGLPRTQLVRHGGTVPSFRQPGLPVPVGLSYQVVGNGVSAVPRLVRHGGTGPSSASRARRHRTVFWLRRLPLEAHGDVSWTRRRALGCVCTSGFGRGGRPFGHWCLNPLEISITLRWPTTAGHPGIAPAQVLPHSSTNHPPLHAAQFLLRPTSATNKCILYA